MDLQRLGAVVAAIKKYWKYSLLSLSSLISQAQALELSKFKLLVNFVDQDGDRGNQVYDNSGNENLTVFEPMIFVVAKVDAETDINAQFVLDTWTAASDTALDGNTGASGAGIEYQSRVSGQIGYKKGNEQNNWSARMGVSSEYDYQSLNFGGTLVRSFAEDNFTLAITPQLFLDQAKDFDLARSQTSEFKGRVIHSLDISGTQILTYTDLLQFGYTYIGMNGYLNNITSKVRVLNDTSNAFNRQQERLPSNRTRHAVSSKWVHGFSDNIALHLAYRYYQDDWKIKAHTPELGFRLSWNDEMYFLMPTFRYHSQSAAEFYKSVFATREDLMTSDSDMDKFHSSRYGLHFSRPGYEFSPFGYKSELELTLGAYWTDRSNDMSYLVLQSGVALSF